MTKFGKSKKMDHPVSYSGLSGFDSFRIGIGHELKHEDLKIQCVLRHGRGSRSIKEPRWMKSKPEAEVTKTRLPDFGNRSIRFSQNR
jgi:hypothetical protein